MRAEGEGATVSKAVMPRTRYAGSKRKLAGWIVGQLGRLEFQTALDAFGGSGAISFELKKLGKQVTYNDVLKFNAWIGTALIENDSRQLTEKQVAALGERREGRRYDTLVARTFRGIYFTNAENRWIDLAVQNIGRLTDRYRRAIGYFALFQSAIIKRPYNLFHRRNLYMRRAKVARTFGNKVTWDRPFAEHFWDFAGEANRAVFDSGVRCRVTNVDAAGVEGSYDLVYLDPPYLNGRGVGVDYRAFYHFLEGLTMYRDWADQVDWSSKHRRLSPQPNRWTNPATVHAAFEGVFARFSGSILAVSYRSDGIPTPREIVSLMKRHKRRVRLAEHDRYQYALSTNRRSREVLIIGT